MLKKIVIGVIVLVVIAAGIAWYLFSNLDSIVKAAIEHYGTAVTQAEVRVDKVTIAISSGTAQISGLTVANPQGFSTAKALELGSITISIDPTSITGSGPIVIKRVDVKQPQVIYELNNSGITNLDTIRKNAAAYGGTARSAGSTRKLIIDDLVIRDGRVGISQTLLHGKSLSVPLPEIHLTNIGRKSGGATPGKVAQDVVEAISSAAAKVGSSAVAKSVGAAVGGAGHGVSGEIKSLIGK